jgi:crossover junction endodeoxyribonuclease RuvC
MRILGVDPGLANFGIGVIEITPGGIEHLEHSSISSKADLETRDRLRLIHDGLCAALDKNVPSLVAIETLYFARNVTSAMGVAQARGVALLALAGRKLEVMEVTPSQIKMSLVGYGRAEKKQVQMMVQQILRLPEAPKPDHAADALAAAITCYHLRRQPGATVDKQGDKK